VYVSELDRAFARDLIMLIMLNLLKIMRDLIMLKNLAVVYV